MGRETGRVKRGAWVGGGLLALFLVLAVLAPRLAPYDPSLPTGLPLAPPGRAHLFGTNDIGQDLLSQWLWGARGSLLVGVLITVLSTVLSWSVGIAAGLWRPLEAPLMAVTDLLLALPAIPLYLLILVVVGPSRQSVVLTLGLLSWPAFARVVRAQVIALRGEPYVDAAKALGASPLRVARCHVLPGTLDLLPAKLVLTLRFAIFAEATLAFLGLGDPTAPSWGTILAWAFNYPLLFTGRVWVWWVLPPAAAIAIVVLATTWLATSFDTTAGRSRSRSRTSSVPSAQRLTRIIPQPVIPSGGEGSRLGGNRAEIPRPRSG